MGKKKKHDSPQEWNLFKRGTKVFDPSATMQNFRDAIAADFDDFQKDQVDRISTKKTECWKIIREDFAFLKTEIRAIYSGEVVPIDSFPLDVTYVRQNRKALEAAGF